MSNVAAWVLAAVLAAGFIAGAQSQNGAADQDGVAARANTLLQGGEVDKALELLDPILKAAGADAETHNLACRAWLAVGRADAAIGECEKAVSLDAQNSNLHLWLGRALGEKADHASFLSAYSLAKRVRAEFEEAVRLDGKNAEALASLGEFDYTAPGVVGGGMDKAEAVAARLDAVDSARAHELRAAIAEGRNDYDGAERELKQAIGVGQHPAYQWMALASFYRRRSRWEDMTAAVHSGASLAQRDKKAAAALYNGAGTLVRANRELPLAGKLLEEYLASPNKTEDAPAFVAYGRLARVKEQLGDTAAADRDRAAALAMAHDYKPPVGKH
jgi:tetratricopeptide (TPR) repeat protein